MRFRTLVPILSVTAALALALGERAARAQASDAAKLTAANAIYEQATAAMDAHDYATACPKLEEVVKLVPQGVGARLTLGECYEKAGKLASAYTAYALAEGLAAQANQAERRQKAHDRAEALKPRLAKLTISVAEAARSLAGLDVQRDGVPVGAVQWGTPIPVDRGRHVITATAGGKQKWERVVEVRVDGTAVTVTIDALADSPAPSPPPPPSPPVAPPASSAPQVGSPPKPAADAPRSAWGARRIAGVATGAVGLVGIGVGAAFGVIAMQKQKASNADGHCHDGNTCDVTGVQLRSESIRAGNTSTVLFVVGGAAAVTGIVLFATAPKTSEPAVTLTAAPNGILVRGTW